MYLRHAASVLVLDMRIPVSYCFQNSIGYRIEDVAVSKLRSYKIRYRICNLQTFLENKRAKAETSDDVGLLLAGETLIQSTKHLTVRSCSSSNNQQLVSQLTISCFKATAWSTAISAVHSGDAKRPRRSTQPTFTCCRGSEVKWVGFNVPLNTS